MCSAESANSRDTIPELRCLSIKSESCLTDRRRLPNCRYMGYNKALIDRFVNMGFEVEKVVEAFIFVGIDRNGGDDYALEEAYMGDVTARLLGEQ